MRASLVVLAFAALLLYLAVPTLAKHGEGGGSDDNIASLASSPSSSTTSSTSSTPSTSAPSFQFLRPANTTTCQNFMLQWRSTNLDVPVTLTVTNDRATGSSGAADTVLISRTLSTNVSVSAEQYMWVDVDVPQGSYVAVAFDTAHTAGVFSQSLPFFVKAGQDSSCLSSSGSTTTPPPNSTSAGSQSNFPDPTPILGAPAESDTSQPKKLSPAVLGGVVAGVVVGVVLLVLVFTFPHYWKEFRLKRARARRPGGPYYLF